MSRNREGRAFKRGACRRVARAGKDTASTNRGSGVIR